ncbi:MAG: hypothetical protein M3280_13435 [Actinomycetota bacterium]|nr:hypothetical protein [Actinomycetota bacterium]
MPTRSDLEKLSSEELHDRAVKRAVTHVDVGFLWSLVKAVPVAEAAAGHLDEAEADVMSLASLITDVVTSGDEPEVADALRPLYIDYLARGD